MLLIDKHGQVDAGILRSWLDARSLSRGLPLSVEDRGAFRVETGAEDELQRFVFARPGPHVTAIAKSIDRSKVLLKLSAPRAILCSLVPSGWSVRAPSWLMATDSWMVGGEIELRAGLSARISQDDAALSAEIRDERDNVCASGRAVRHAGIFIYDQIETRASFRRQGLATRIMKLLEQAGRSNVDMQVLTATNDGRALYESLGWQVVSEYCTAEIS